MLEAEAGEHRIDPHGQKRENTDRENPPIASSLLALVGAVLVYYGCWNVKFTENWRWVCVYLACGIIAWSAGSWFIISWVIG